MEGVETRRGAPKAKRAGKRSARRDGEGIVQRTNGHAARYDWRRKTWCEENPPLNSLPVRVRSPAPHSPPVALLQAADAAVSVNPPSSISMARPSSWAMCCLASCSQIDNGEVRVSHAGESWMEKPGVHGRRSTWGRRDALELVQIVDWNRGHGQCMGAVRFIFNMLRCRITRL